MASPHRTLTSGELNAAVSEAVVRLLSEYAGRGPTKARTIHSGRFVLCVLEDTMTQAERSIAARGQEDVVLKARQALQGAMQEDLITAVEELTQRRVVALMSDNNIEPDLAAEVFILDEPVPVIVDVAAQPAVAGNGAGIVAPAPPPSPRS